MYWLKCQEGLFYQVMRLLRDHKLGGRLHVVICIRDIVMSSVYRSEHAPRYYNEPHIRILSWDRGSLLYLLEQKLRRLPPSLLMRRAARGSPTVSDWLRRRAEGPAAALAGVVARCAKRFGDSQLAQCANQITSDLIPAGAALQDYSDLFTS